MLRTNVRSGPRRFAILLAAALLLPGVACREDPVAPTQPGTEAQPLSATTAAALAFYQVTTGERHSCGITTANRAYCWGLNDKGQLGDGTHETRLTPRPIGGTLRFRQIAAAYGHTCAITTDFLAYCWGQGVDGELGDGAAVDRSTPVRVAGGRQFRQIDPGQNHTCAVSYPDNRAFCWGYNGSAAIGDGTFAWRKTPAAVSGGLLFRQVDAGGFHSCGVTTTNRAYCWGYNRVGQLGDSLGKGFRTKPSPVTGGHAFRQISAGHEATCAVTTSDRAWCWGDGTTGQLGNGLRSVRVWPRAVSGGLAFTRVTVGMAHTCGEATSKRAYCWGTNANGQLGDGTTIIQQLKPSPVAGGLGFYQLSAGGAHTCGKTGASVAYCWGANFSGQLGNGLTAESRTPVAVAGP
jgi:alpha-tubulin suppressor-like RCC1 family protein